LLEGGELSADEIAVEVPLPTGEAGTLEVLEWGYETLRARVEAPAEATLFIAEAFTDGWRAFVDGTEVPLHRANVLGRAVVVPAGAHQLELRYRTPGLRVGAALGGLGLLLALAAAGWQRRRG
ncbi:MAG: YfhO family protein, partial [Myxococcales bacterium]